MRRREEGLTTPVTTPVATPVTTPVLSSASRAPQKTVLGAQRASSGQKVSQVPETLQKTTSTVGVTQAQVQAGPTPHAQKLSSSGKLGSQVCEGPQKIHPADETNLDPDGVPSPSQACLEACGSHGPPRRTELEVISAIEGSPSPSKVHQEKER